MEKGAILTSLSDSCPKDRKKNRSHQKCFSIPCRHLHRWRDSTPRLRLRKHSFLLVLEPHIMRSLSCWLIGALEAVGGHCRLWAGPSGEGEVGGGGGGWWGDESSLSSCCQKRAVVSGARLRLGCFHLHRHQQLTFQPCFFVWRATVFCFVFVFQFGCRGNWIPKCSVWWWHYSPQRLHHPEVRIQIYTPPLPAGCPNHTNTPSISPSWAFVLKVLWSDRDSPSGAECFQLHPSWHPGSGSSQGEPFCQRPPANACLHRSCRCAAPPCPGSATSTKSQYFLSWTFPWTTGARQQLC